MIQLMQDPGFVYGIAFILFVALAFVYGRQPTVKWLDSEIAKVSAELANARQLRAEAEVALAQCKEKQARAEDEAKLIVKAAKEQVDAIRKQAEADLHAQLARQKQMAFDRIQAAQNEAIAQVRGAAIDAAMNIARKNLTSDLSSGDADNLVNQALADVPKLKIAAK